ncbi:MAG: FtsH protease activity modulator HflK [bacterium]|nr:FtsH protease activity modulator HflK [bacterium]
MSRPKIILGGRRFDPSQLKVLRWLPILILVPILLLMSYFTVPADSVGVVLRFGAFSSEAPPGLHFKIPFVDSVTLVPIQRRLKLEFGFATPGATDDYQASSRREQKLESNMVTGDTNAAVVEWVVQYHIDHPQDFLFKVRNPATTLRDVGEAAMRQVIGDRTIDEVITVGRREIEEAAGKKMQELAKDYSLGVEIEEVQLKNVNPPEPVRQSFNEVNRAEQDRENMINVANGEYNKVIPKAEGEAEQRISEAEGYKLQRVNEAKGDVAAFRSVFEQFLKAPDATRTRLYLETMSTVLPRMQGKWVVDDRVTQLIPMLQGIGAPASNAASNDETEESNR